MYSFICRVKLKALLGSPFLPRSSFLSARWYQSSCAVERKSTWSSSCHRCPRVFLMADFVSFPCFQGTSGSILNFSEFMRMEIVFLGQPRSLFGNPMSISCSFDYWWYFWDPHYGTASCVFSGIPHTCIEVRVASGLFSFGFRMAEHVAHGSMEQMQVVWMSFWEVRKLTVCCV